MVATGTKNGKVKTDNNIDAKLIEKTLANSKATDEIAIAIDNDDLDIGDIASLEITDTDDDTDGNTEDKIQDEIFTLIGKLTTIDWQDTNIDRGGSAKLDNDTLVALSGTFSTGMSFKSKVGIVRINYGVGDILISADNREFILIGSIDKKGFVPSDKVIHHDLMTTPKYKGNIYQVAVNKALDSFDLTTNYKHAVKSELLRRAKKSQQSDNAKRLKNLKKS